MKSMAVIGCGNLASAIIKGFKNSGLKLNYHMYTPSFTRAKNLADEVAAIAHKNIADIPECDFYLLGFKPQQLKEASADLKKFISKKAIVISLLASTSIEKLENIFSHSKFIRIMANTPIQFGQGIALEQASKAITPKERQEVKKLFQTISEVISLEQEDLFDYAMLIAASGPAYLMSFALYFEEILISKGIKKDQAQTIVKKLFSGTSFYMKEMNEPLNELIAKVTSKAGVTAKVLEVFEQKKLRAIFDEGIEAGFKRSQELNSYKPTDYGGE